MTFEKTKQRLMIAANANGPGWAPLAASLVLFLAALLQLAIGVALAFVITYGVWSMVLGVIGREAFVGPWGAIMLGAATTLAGAQALRNWIDAAKGDGGDL